MSNDNDLKVLIVSSEVTPYSKSGGLGDVVGSLPEAIFKKGVDIRIVLPKYKNINETLISDKQYLDSFVVSLSWRNQSASIYRVGSGVPTYLIENDYYFGRDGLYGYGDDFERFAFFSKASVEFLSNIQFKPDIIHFNDWQTGLGSVYLKDLYGKFLFYSDIKSLYTIHNLQYQGVFGKEVLGSVDLNDGYYQNQALEFHGNISFMKAGITYSDAVSTVSETYAREIQTAQYGYGMDGVLRTRSDRLHGILNGIDIEKNNPETDPRLYENYSIKNLQGKKANKSALQQQLGLPVRDVPVIGIISRLVDQKGLDLVAVALDELVSKDIQFVVLGTGEGRYENLFKHYAWKAPDKVSANILFNENLAQKIYAASDMFLMPSLFEPCGLGQMFAMRYGTVPIVRHTGGLADTVTHYDPRTKTGTGFVFNDYIASGMMWAVNEALRTYHMENGEWENVVRNAMSADSSWDRSADKYIELYQSLKAGK